MILRFDHKNRKVQLSLRGEEICNKLQEKENNGDQKYVLVLVSLEFFNLLCCVKCLSNIINKNHVIGCSASVLSLLFCKLSINLVIETFFKFLM